MRSSRHRYGDPSMQPLATQLVKTAAATVGRQDATSCQELQDRRRAQLRQWLWGRLFVSHNSGLFFYNGKCFTNVFVSFLFCFVLF